MHLSRAILTLLAFVVIESNAATTRLAVLYAEKDELQPRSFGEMIVGMEYMAGVEILRLTLDGRRGFPIQLASAAGNVGSIAVLYPDIGEPYRGIFAKIIEGIEDKAKNKVTSFAVGSRFDPDELSNELKRQDIRVVIALGRNGLKAASDLDRDINIVVGGVVSAPDMESRVGAVISLAPDPALLFARLKAFSPNTQRVFVVYTPRQNDWLIKLAREAAQAQKLELMAFEAADLKSAVGRYQAIFSGIDPRRDALWLPQDSTTADESTVLPMVLQESWDRNVPLFSSTVAHVKRGALFSLFPNNVELGRNLAASALGVASGTAPGRGSITPLREVLTAVNTRTANHLGLRLSSRPQNFDLVFPEQ